MVAILISGSMMVSLSARRAWIEIICLGSDISIFLVALRKESVDRNTQRRDFKRLGLVALRKESVDRNADASKISKLVFASLSARRAWIEILRISLSGQDSRGRSPQGERG